MVVIAAAVAEGDGGGDGDGDRYGYGVLSFIVWILWSVPVYGGVVGNNGVVLVFTVARYRR